MNVAHFGLVLDCADPETLAEFWAPALGYVKVGTAGAFVALRPDGGPGPKLLLRRVPEPKTVKNRMHLDIEVADIQAESGRLVALGATRIREAPCSEHGAMWQLMADPEGNEFCICDGGEARHADG
jgi:predicted enzyme related to lactoylglutathione lyase